MVERAMILSNHSILYIDILKIERSIKQQVMSLEELDKQYIVDILERTGWRIRGRKGAAEILGLKPTTLDSKIKKLGISRRPKSTEYHRLSEI